MIAILSTLLLLAAQPDSPPAPPASGGRVQTFVAPSGEPFRVNGDAAYPVAAWFSGADKNADGKLDLEEFTADFLRFFDQLDVNHDGAIDSVERTRYENQIVPETLGGSSFRESQQAQSVDDSDIAGEGASGTTDPPKPKYGANPIGAARFDLLGLPEPVAAMDTELRGRISRRVAQDAARQRFGALDDLHRGYLTLDRLPPTYAQHGGGHRGGEH
jgi:hypothetical protein